MLRAVASLHALWAFVMRAPDKNSRARANYSRAFLSIFRAVAFSTCVFVRFKTSGTVFQLHFFKSYILREQTIRTHTKH